MQSEILTKLGVENTLIVSNSTDFCIQLLLAILLTKMHIKWTSVNKYNNNLVEFILHKMLCKSTSFIIKSTIDLRQSHLVTEYFCVVIFCSLVLSRPHVYAFSVSFGKYCSPSIGFHQLISWVTTCILLPNDPLLCHLRCNFSIRLLCLFCTHGPFALL